MSKIGKTPIVLKNGITAKIQPGSVLINGPKGQFDYKIPEGVEVIERDNKLIVALKNQNNKNYKAIHGLVRASLANLTCGAEKEFEKKLELSGVGYKAQIQGSDLVLSLGFSHPVRFAPKQGIKISVANNAVIISGSDKALVGETAASIRRVKPPEPYKGKGIKYAGEKIRRKAGKAAKATGTK